MIIIFEPQCRGFQHEQFNAGFLYGYSLAYPEEKIVFWGEKEHIQCIKTIFSSANLSLDNTEFVELEIPNPDLLMAVFEYSKIIKGLLSYSYKNNCDKIVLLSIHTYNLIPLKYLLQFKYKNTIRVHVAMHGILESVKRKNSSFLLEFFEKGTRYLKKTMGIENRQGKHEPKNKYLYEKLFKMSMHLFNNKNITYFVFREDSLLKLNKYLPKIYKYFKSIDLPYIYKNVRNINFDTGSSNLMTFATFEKGYSNELRKIVRVLIHDNTLSDNFEIRILGGNVSKNLDTFEQIKYIGDSGKLLREEIEESIIDARYVLLFYPENSYELMPSGVFFDAIAYSKPVVFLKNHCLDYYYEKYKFGYRCNNVDEMIDAMGEIISTEESSERSFVSEIIRMQQDITISNNYLKLRFAKETTMKTKRTIPGRVA